MIDVMGECVRWLVAAMVCMVSTTVVGCGRAAWCAGWSAGGTTTLRRPLANKRCRMAGGRRLRSARGARVRGGGVQHLPSSVPRGEGSVARGGRWKGSGRAEPRATAYHKCGYESIGHSDRTRAVGSGMRIFVGLVVVLTVTMRFGEADNPGPPRVLTTFDQAEGDGFPEVYDAEELAEGWRDVELDGVEAQEDEGMREYDAEIRGTERASLPPELYLNTAAASNEGEEGRAFRWPSDALEDLELDELAGIVEGAYGGRTEPNERCDAVGDRAREFYRDHGLVADEPDITVVGRATAGVALPRGLEEQLNAEDRRTSAHRAAKWSSFFADVVKARKETEELRSKGLVRRGARAGSGCWAIGAGYVPMVPVVQEEMDEEQAAMDIQPTDALAAASPPIPARRFRRRARGRRQRGMKEATVVLINSSGAPQAKRAIITAAASTENVVAIMGQEHHQRDHQAADLQSFAREQRWAGAIVPAVKGEGGGASAGVAIFTPSHVPAGLLDQRHVDHSPVGSEGRLGAVWIQNIVPCGVLAITMYLHTAEGPTPRNVRLVAKALEVADASGGPWVLAADWQDTPESVQAWAGGMITRARAVIVAPDQPTVYPSTGEPRVIDFFVISEHLVPQLRSVTVDEDYAAAPHRAVALKFGKADSPQLQWVARGPRKFQRDKPIGCPRAPVAPSSGELGILNRSEPCEGDSAVAAAAWTAVVRAMEAEWCGVTDRFVGDHPDASFCGREHGPKYVQAPVLPSRAMGSLGKQCMTTHAMRWAENRLGEMANLSAIAERAGGRRAWGIDDVGLPGAEGSGLGTGQWAQWDRLVRKFCSPKSVTLMLAVSDDRWSDVNNQVARYGACPAAAGDFLRTTAGWASAAVTSAAQASRSTRRAAWRRWLSTQIGRGGGGLHAFVKRRLQEPERAIMWEGGNTVAMQDVVDKDTEDWSGVWLGRAAFTSAPWREAGALEDSLPRPTVSGMRKAGMSFRANTGTGIDGCPPRHYSWLSDHLLDVLIDLIVFLESAGIWPAQLREAVMRLIPKPSGGRRPIGLLASFIRLWERVRRPEVRRWRIGAYRTYNWMTKAKGAQRAVWTQSILDEAARQNGLSSAAVLVDLVKAFEQVILAGVWTEGLRHGFPARLLRLSMEACAFPRRLAYGAAHGKRAVETLSATLAGSGLASDFMFIVLIGPLDQLLREFSSLTIFVIADDVKLGVTGADEDKVSAEMSKVSARCVELLEDGLHMEISRDTDTAVGKTVAVASSAALKRKLAGRLSRLGIRVKDRVRNLGVDYQLAGRKRRVEQQARVTLWKGRGKRVARLGRQGAAHVIRTAAVASTTYGATVTGMTDSMLSCIRTMMASAFGPLGGRSATARLAMEGCDPGHKVVVQPVVDWFREVWEGIVDAGTLRDAWRYAQRTVGMSARPNVAVRGGGGAYIAALRRLGWKSPAPDTVVTRDGTMLYLGRGAAPERAVVADPRTIKKWAAEDYEAATLACSQLARDLADIGGVRGYPRCVQQLEGDNPARAYGSSDAERRMAISWRAGRCELREGEVQPWIWPMHIVAKAARRRGRRSAAASLRSCVEGGWWTQRRLFNEGVVAHDRCRCGKAAGTLWHRLGGCELSEEVRSRLCPAPILKNGQSSVWDPLYSRGVPCRPKVPPPPPSSSWWFPRAEGVTKTASGDVYTDGSAVGWYWRAVRAGWAAVAVDTNGKELWAMSGTCSEVNASIFRAELKAVMETLRIAVPPLRIHVDNAQVVHGFSEGEEWCVGAGREAADMWRDVWHMMNEIGGGVEVVKVPAHTTWWQVLTGAVSLKDHLGNTAADREAKAAMRAAMVQSSTVSFNACLARAVGWARWMLDYASHWVDDTSVPPSAGEEAGRARSFVQGGGGGGRDTLSHEVWETSDTSLCRRCGRSAPLGMDRKPYLMEACRGAAGGRLMAQSSGNRNYIWGLFFYTEREMRARGARLVAATSVPRAMVDEERLHDMEIVEEGQSIAARAATRRREDDADDVENRASVRRRVEESGARALWSSPPSWLYLPAQGIGVGMDIVPPEEMTVRGETRGFDDGELARSTRRRIALEGQVPPGEEEGGSATGRGRDDGREHVLAATGAFIWCRRCARYAHLRVGVGLRGDCRPSRGDATRRRLDLLRQGLHPITGERLQGDGG